MVPIFMDFLLFFLCFSILDFFSPFVSLYLFIWVLGLGHAGSLAAAHGLLVVS